MSFIKLQKNEILNTKISNIFKTSFNKEDITTHLSDKNNNSKSLVFTDKIFKSTFQNKLNLNEPILSDAFSTFDAIANNINVSGFNAGVGGIISKDYSYNVISTLKDQLAGLLSVEDIKNSKFKNYFSIDRNTNKLILFDKFQDKNNTVKTTLYDFYNSGLSSKEYKELDYGFCNYNSINMFSNKYNENRLHSNCIVYSNTIVNGKNEVDFSENFYVNFWINVRKNTQNKRSCILHIPDVFSLYTSEFTDNFRIALTFGQECKKILIEENFDNVNFSDPSKQITEDIYLSPASIFDYNKWFNVGINFIKTEGNKYTIALYKNGEIVDNVDVNIVKEKANLFNSYMCIGNMPYYLKEDQTYNVEYEEIFKTFFNKHYTAEESFDGPFYKKDLSLGVNSEIDLSDVVNDIFSQQNNIVFKDQVDLSSSMNAELHDIKIYNTSVSSEKIKIHYNRTLENLTEEKSEGLSFYLPCFYIPASVKKIGLFNNSISNINLYFNCLYNPIYSNTCGGLDLSVENFLVDFVNYKKPNIVINGNLENNIAFNYNENFLESLVNNELNFEDIRKGSFSADIITKQIIELGANDNNNLLLYNNNSYRNMLLLPNDNGLPLVKFNVIEEVLESNISNIYNLNETFYKSEYGNTKYYNINCFDVLGEESQYLLDNKNYDFYTYEPPLVEGPFGPMPEQQYYTLVEYNGISNKNSQALANNFKLLDISKFIELDQRLSSVFHVREIRSGITAGEGYIYNIVNDFYQSYKFTSSNPVTRDYNSSNFDITSAGVKLQEDITYRFLPIPNYEFNKYKKTMFNVLFDISNQYYGERIEPKSFNLKDVNLGCTNNKVSITILDNGAGQLFRNDCKTKVAEWNYIGHVFYDEGIVNILNPFVYNLGMNNFTLDFYSKYNMYVNEINIPVVAGTANKSFNNTYDSSLRHDNSSLNSDEPFVYITDINIHDENLNVVAKAKMAHPIPKKNTDNLLIRLKMDF